MSEKYKLIKHNKNLAEIGNDRGVGLLFLVDEDCERKLEIIVDLLNKLYEENEALKKFIKDNFNEMMDSKMVIGDESFEFNKNCAKPYEIRSVSQNGVVRTVRKIVKCLGE